jgi:DinB family protein
MTSAERDRAVAYLKETQAAMIDSTRGLSDAQWRYKPSPDEWSIAECVEHLGIVEERALRGVQKMASAPPAPEDQLALAAGKEDLIVEAAPARRKKFAAPPLAIPKGEWSDSHALIARFVEVREHAIAYASTTSDPLRTRLLPHPAFGPLDGFQWLILFGAHCERHRRQLEEIKTSAGFPVA